MFYIKLGGNNPLSEAGFSTRLVRDNRVGYPYNKNIELV